MAGAGVPPAGVPAPPLPGAISAGGRDGLVTASLAASPGFGPGVDGVGVEGAGVGAVLWDEAGPLAAAPNSANVRTPMILARM